MPFGQLDFLYVPSHDVAADSAYFTTVLGGRLVFAIEDGGTRVAMVELTDGPPQVLLTDHLDGAETILIYRVGDLAATLGDLEGRGWDRAPSFEIPQGPCCSFRTPGGQRIALYEPTRPGVLAHFRGRRDF